MSKKKDKAQNDFISLLTLVISGMLFITTKSWIVTIISFIFLLIVYAVILYGIRVKKESKLRMSGILEIDKMDGVQFEHYLMALFKKHGYRVKLTPSSNDFGADLLLKSKEEIVVQAKRYKNKVGIKAVQEIVSAKNYYQANQAWVVTNNFFTSQAVKLANASNVKLIDRKSLINMIQKINPDVTAKEIRETVSPKPIKCDKCGNPMVVRKGKNGDFFGCSTYPSCNNTKPIAN